jgi:hypothetical protein
MRLSVSVYMYAYYFDIISGRLVVSVKLAIRTINAVPQTAYAISIQSARYITVVPSRMAIPNEYFSACFSCCVVQNTTIT